MTDVMIEKIGENPDKVFFPNLGTDNFFTNGIEINRAFFRIPGTKIDIYWYGFLIGIGVLLAIIYGFRKFGKFGINSDKATDSIIGGVLGAIVGARLYYVVFSWSNYYYDKKIHWIEIFSTRDGGLAIYGGIIGALLVGGLIAKWRKIKLAPLFDIAAMGLLIGQAIGRWGNFVNQEAFGTVTKLPWGMTSQRIMNQLGDYLPNEPTGNLLAHPCFLYESLWCIVGFIVLNIYMKHRKFDGEIFLMYIGWYGLGRVFIEGLRTDSLYITGTHLRVSQLLAGVCVVVAVLLIGIIRVKVKKNGDYKFFYETEISKQQIAEYNILKKKTKENLSDSIDSAFDEKKSEVNTSDEINIAQLEDDDDDDFDDDDGDD